MMGITTYLLPSVVFATTAIAQCSNSNTFTITKTADASQIASCTTYSGSIAVPTDLSDAGDANGKNSLDISGSLEEIDGNIAITGASLLQSLSFGKLKTITGILSLGGLTVLSELSMPNIDQIQKLNITALPALQSLSFGSDGVNQAQSILISNTGLSSLKGLDQLASVDNFLVNNNNALMNISLSVSQIKNAIRIEANNGDQAGTQVSFPSLQTAQNMTFRNCSSVNLPALGNVSAYLGFYGNNFESFTAPNLTTTGGLVFVDNTKLTNISIPQLTSVNASLQIANNTQLKKIDGIQSLNAVVASLDLNGNFTEVDLPNLKQVRGAFNLQTSAQFDCSPFDTARKNGVIKGKYVCAGTQVAPGGEGSKPSSTSGKTGASGAAQANSVNYPTIIGGSSLIVGLLQLLW